MKSHTPIRVTGPNSLHRLDRSFFRMGECAHGVDGVRGIRLETRVSVGRFSTSDRLLNQSSYPVPFSLHLSFELSRGDLSPLAAVAGVCPAWASTDEV